MIERVKLVSPVANANRNPNQSYSVVCLLTPFDKKPVKRINHFPIMTIHFLGNRMNVLWVWLDAHGLTPKQEYLFAQDHGVYLSKMMIR